ncbi:uroplakin-1a [Ictalurus punctatus]|uniref:Tetraspanin n=1 Tax=Ictalurus punctatus TaxID=7998 RepID=W5U8H0_ICTPU|nr:uroplakin-1a [Ictalurus punctatus]XP_053467780.1 uroplakin-1a [Ictalurus furcatus]
MANGGIIALMVVVVILNVVAAAAGLALCALAIWVAVDPYKVYPISAVSGKDDIFAAAWIAIFTGFAYFCTAIFGIYAALKRKRSLVLLYLILMFIIFIFECASCITAVTNRDYLIGNSNLVKNQMLKYYAQDSNQGRQITGTWNKVMNDAQCCGTDSPMDWIEYNSTFKQTYGSTYTWPLNCCQRQNSFDPADPVGCMFGQTSAVFSKGCFNYIQTVLNRYTWSVSWYGFAVQMFVFFLLLITIVYFLLLE